MMTPFESEAARVIDKLNEGNFELWKFKIKILLASMNFWNIMDGSKDVQPFNANSKVLKEYKRRVKKAMSMIGLNLTDNQLVHIKNYKRPVEAWMTFYNIHKTKSLYNILFIRRKIFTCKTQEGDDLLNHINKVKVITN